MYDQLSEYLGSQADDVSAGERAFRKLDGGKRRSRNHIALLVTCLESALYLGDRPRSRLAVTLQIVQPHMDCGRARFGRDDGLRGTVDESRANDHSLCCKPGHRDQGVFDE